MISNSLTLYLTKTDPLIQNFKKFHYPELVGNGIMHKADLDESDLHLECLMRVLYGSCYIILLIFHFFTVLVIGDVMK